MCKYITIYTETLMEVCVKTKGIEKGVPVCPGVRHFHGVETLERRRGCWQRKPVMLESGEGILDQADGWALIENYIREY